MRPFNSYPVLFKLAQRISTSLQFWAWHKQALIKGDGRKDYGVIICADDFGLAPGVNRAILALLAAYRISSVSCMTVGLDWQSGAPELKRYSDRVDLGLHLTLSGGGPAARPVSCAHVRKDGSFYDFKSLFLKSLLSRLDEDLIFLEFAAQLERFKSDIGRNPDFVDGHQHIHQLPVIERAVFRLVNTTSGKLYVRNSRSPLPWRLPWHLPKVLFLTVPGIRFRRKLRDRGISTNPYLLGIRSLKRFGPEEMVNHFKSEAARASAPNALMIVHPGFVDDFLRASDGYVEGRLMEFEALMSRPFNEFLELNLIERKRFQF